MTEPRWLDAEELRAWQAFLAAGALVGRRVEQQLKDQAGLSHVQYEVLVRLAGAEHGEVRMNELADALFTSKSGLSYQIGQMEKCGLVRRRPCDREARGVLACLTDLGRAKLAEVAPGHVEAVRGYVLDRLERRELTLVADALERIADGAAEGADWRPPGV
ncbi:MAG TPA: MarR family transcriptional regulator [Actinospica sp.]|nr:MarR family transcriptional regulator [Actinospica sp.]